MAHRKKIDGRILRSQRTRQRLITAYRFFAARGVLDPQGMDIARRAGVAIRSVYQHFAGIAEPAARGADR